MAKSKKIKKKKLNAFQKKYAIKTGKVVYLDCGIVLPDMFITPYCYGCR